MPHHIGNVISASTVSKLSDIGTDQVVPMLLLKVADTAGEQASSNEVEETSGYDKEDLHLGRRAAPVFW